ncbi:hypothetical protein F511_16603 [Dorcoceras hygrometricum]|uniref:Uncharacterized protein n=1 Tax=Dorcoceras hygrometricum TaxID=472368 RepID=A0A2Z7CAM3_9LAMI|nr:hypothetical protein F511_16603 [Dorcoceras hygrometricum]
MQSPCVGAFETFSSLSQSINRLQLLGIHAKSSSPRRRYGSYPCISCDCSDHRSMDVRTRGRRRGEFEMKAKGKENVWSVDNEVARLEKEKERTRRRRSKEGKRVRIVSRNGDTVMVSASMLTEVETVLQTQVISVCAMKILVWNSFYVDGSGKGWWNHGSHY